MIRITQVVPVQDASQVGTARRKATQCAEALRFSETMAGRVAIVATELATNLIKHGQGGSLLFGSDDLIPKALTIVAIDKGPGMHNVSAALRDGYSTAGTHGTGLGAVRRSSGSFDMYSKVDQGTVVVSHIRDDAGRALPSSNAPSRMVIGGIAIPIAGEEENGDAWMAMPGRDVYTVAVADGLGHGPGASSASSAAVRTFVERADQPLERLMEDMHAALRATRGAAVGIARIHASLNRVDFLGVGNIAGTIISDDAQRKTVSLPGIVGHEMRKLQTFSYPWSASSVLVLHSDGLSASWNPASMPGLMQHDPTLIAALLYRDHCRGTDDATVVVAKASA